jgi:exonuclease III
MNNAIRIATVNCQGLATPQKRQDVLNYYKKTGYSIICLQDTHFTYELQPYIETQWGFKCVFSSFKSNSRGVSILFNNDFEFKIHKEKGDCEGNLVALDMTVEGSRLTLLNVYGPNSDCPDFYEKIREIFLEFDNDFYILCGDLNIALNPTIDTYNYKNINNPKAREKLLEIMEDLQIIDYYRVLNPEKRVYTWRKKNPCRQGRLDYILFSEGLSNLVQNFTIKPGYRSDHSIVVLELKFSSFNKGCGLWKFNNSLLHDKTYVDRIKQTIQRVKGQYLQNPTSNDTCHDYSYIDNINDSAFLEVLLMEIRGTTISYSSYKKKTRDQLEKSLVEEIERLESQNKCDTDIFEEKKLSLEALRKEKMQGHLIRSRARWVEEGEKPTKYFCNLESRNYINKVLKRVDIEGQDTIYDQFEILDKVKTFYKDLYGNRDSELLDLNLKDIIVDNSQIKKLDEKSINHLESDIVESEVLSVLKNMKNNKSPGSDGFTAEFFKFFWNDLKYYILRAISCIFENKELPISQRLGIITCIPKGDKPRQYLKNWRPITLLNVLYKLISGCLSNRMKSSLDVIISDTQSGFMKGRYIGENTRFIYDLMSYTESKNIPGLLVLVDFEKAFDSVSWCFMYKVLNYFGFGKTFIEWIKILNTNFKASVLQYGHLSDQIHIQRGCRQGDPIAPYLFLLCAEILAILVKQNKDIKGITISQREHKISQYADDTSLALDGSPASLFAALDTLDFFSKLSGLNVNSSKTKIIWIGSKKFSNQVFHHPRWKLDWGSTSFSLLGIQFSVDLESVTEINYDIVLPKIKSMIQQWKRRILTPIGRVTIVKSLILPKFNHIFISLPTPNTEKISSLCRDIFEFIWKSKCDRVKRSVVTQDHQSGGLKMVNIDNFIKSLKCSWMKRLVTTNDKPWMDIFFAINGSDVVKNLLDFGDQYISSFLMKKNNIFWKDVFSAWQHVTKKIEQDKNVKFKIFTLPIWYNSSINIGGKCIFIKNWYQHGVKIVGDFLSDDNSFLSKYMFEQKFHISDISVMQYNSVISALSKCFKVLKIERTCILKTCFPYLPFYFENILPNVRCTNIIYNCINTTEVTPTSIPKWKLELSPHGINDICLRDVFKVCFKTTSDSSVQWLQYRLLHRILPVGYYLKKIHVKSTDICNLCKTETETLQHIFVSCSEVLTLWSALSLHIYRTTSKRVGFNFRNIILGELPLSKDNRNINFIILYTKQYIFNSSLQCKAINILGLLNHLKAKYNIERCISIYNSNQLLFEKQWNLWNNIFEPIE